MDATVEDIYEISLKSAKAREKKIFIYEKSDLSKIIGNEKAEELRKLFLKNGITVKQITNVPLIPSFSKNDEFVNNCMFFRYLPKETYTIDNEMLIFDDTVAFYNIEPKIELTIIKDKKFAENQKQLFMNLWEQGQTPKVGFEYKPNHSFYNPINFTIQNKHVIVYPDKDALESYREFEYYDLDNYLKDILAKNQEYFKNADYLIIFLWNYKGEKMMDVWKFDPNSVDDRSGPTGGVKIFQNGKVCKKLGMASGNTLLVLGYEEKLRRQSQDLMSYFKGPSPHLPLELLNGIDFFSAKQKLNKLI